MLSCSSRCQRELWLRVECFILLLGVRSELPRSDEPHHVWSQDPFISHQNHGGGQGDGGEGAGVFRTFAVLRIPGRQAVLVVLA